MKVNKHLRVWMLKQEAINKEIATWMMTYERWLPFFEDGTLTLDCPHCHQPIEFGLPLKVPGE